MSLFSYHFPFGRFCGCCRQLFFQRQADQQQADLNQRYQNSMHTSCGVTFVMFSTGISKTSKPKRTVNFLGIWGIPQSSPSGISHCSSRCVPKILMFLNKVGMSKTLRNGDCRVLIYFNFSKDFSIYFSALGLLTVLLNI